MYYLLHCLQSDMGKGVQEKHTNHEVLSSCKGRAPVLAAQHHHSTITVYPCSTHIHAAGNLSKFKDKHGGMLTLYYMYYVPAFSNIELVVATLACSLEILDTG